MTLTFLGLMVPSSITKLSRDSWRNGQLTINGGSCQCCSWTFDDVMIDTRISIGLGYIRGFCMAGVATNSPVWSFSFFLNIQEALLNYLLSNRILAPCIINSLKLSRILNATVVQYTVRPQYFARFGPRPMDYSTLLNCPSPTVGPSGTHCISVLAPPPW